MKQVAPWWGLLTADLLQQTLRQVLDSGSPSGRDELRAQAERPWLASPVVARQMPVWIIRRRDCCQLVPDFDPRKWSERFPRRGLSGPPGSTRTGHGRAFVRPTSLVPRCVSCGRSLEGPLGTRNPRAAARGRGPTLMKAFTRRAVTAAVGGVAMVGLAAGPASAALLLQELGHAQAAAGKAGSSSGLDELRGASPRCSSSTRQATRCAPRASRPSRRQAGGVELDTMINVRGTMAGGANVSRRTGRATWRSRTWTSWRCDAATPAASRCAGRLRPSARLTRHLHRRCFVGLRLPGDAGGASTQIARSHPWYRGGSSFACGTVRLSGRACSGGRP